MKKSSLLTNAAIITLLFTFLLPGCASFSSGNLPETPLVKSTSKEKKPSVYADLTFLIQDTDSESQGVPKTSGRRELGGIFKDALKESDMFSRYTTDSFEGRKYDYIMEVTMEKYGRYSVSFTNAMVAGASLGLIPLKTTDNFRLTAKILDRKKNVLGEYAFEESVTTWVHLTMLLLAPIKPPAIVMKDVQTNMVHILLTKAAKDGVFKPSENVMRMPLSR